MIFLPLWLHLMKKNDENRKEKKTQTGRPPGDLKTRMMGVSDISQVLKYASRLCEINGINNIPLQYLPRGSERSQARQLVDL